MSRSSVILRNVASNWAGFAVNAAVTLVLTPFVLHQLGSARYGIWILTSSIIGYYGLLDLGFRAGVTQYLTRYLATSDYEKASECISSAVAVLAGLGGLMLGLSVTAAYMAPHLFNLPGGMEREAFWCILIVGSSSAIQFALNPYTAVFTATQRFDLANLIGVTTRLLTAGGIVLSLKLGGGLVGVSAALCATSVIDYVIRWRVARRLAPQLVLARRHMSMRRVREIGAFGAWNSLMSINQFVYQHVPNMLIGFVMPIAAVGHYALATGLSRQINSLLSPVPQVLYPAAAAMHVRGDHRGLERLYHDGSRLTMLVMIPLVLAATFWAPDFYRLWIGEKFLSLAAFTSVAVLFQVLLISTATSYSSSIAQQILVGAGHVRLVAISLLCASTINLVLSLVLIRFYGLAGVAMAVVIASTIVDLIAMPLMLQRRLGLSILSFIRHACVRPVAAGVLQALIIAGTIRIGGHAGSWLHLIEQGVLAGAASAIVLLVIGVTKEERQKLIVAPLRRFFGATFQASPAPPVTVRGER